MSKKEIEQNKKNILGMLSEVKREGIDDLVNWLTESNFFTSPASTMFHGNYEGGLALHSYKVYEEFWRQAQHYNLPVTKETAVLTGLLHDACKIGFYIPNELKSGKISEAKPYKTEDPFPIGHGEKSVMLVQKYLPLTEQEAMIIRWHMGPYDKSWEDYQDKIEEKFPEVLVFHHADIEVSKIYKV